MLFVATPILAETTADQQARLAAATNRPDAATGRAFTTSRRIRVDLDNRVLSTWLAAVAPNGLRSSATGTAAEGAVALRQRPLLGAITATIAQASATRLDLTLANPRISAVRDRLTVTGNLAGTARAEVRVTGPGLSQSVACRTDPPVREPGTASFSLGAASGTRYPFTLRLATPDNLVASLECDIAELRRIENVLPVNSLAGQLADGTIDIGLAPELQLPTPGAGRPLIIPLNPRRPSLRITPGALA